MPTVPLNSSLEDEYQNQLYKLKLKRFYNQRQQKFKSLLLLGVSIIFFIVAAFYVREWLHFFIVVIIAGFVWLMFGLSNLMDASSLDRAEHRLRKEVEGYFDPSYRASVAFDETEVSLLLHTLDEKKVTLTWDQFTGYNDSGEVLLLATSNPKCIFSFTRPEMGEEAFAELRRLAKEKLPTIKSFYEEKNHQFFWWLMVEQTR